MCRKNVVLGVLVGAVGIGLILSSLFQSGVFNVFLGAVLIAAGLLVIYHR